MGANLNNHASLFATPLATHPGRYASPHFKPVNELPANNASPYANPVIPNQVSESGLVGSSHNQANKHDGHDIYRDDKEALTPGQNTISLNSHLRSYSMHESLSPSTPRMRLDAYKLDNTMLWISDYVSSTTAPITLRSCMTISKPFNYVLKICGLAEQQGKVLGLKTTIMRKEDPDFTKSLMLMRAFDETFGFS